MTTKEQKAMEACRSLMAMVRDHHTFTNKDLANTIELAQEAIAPEASTMATTAATALAIRNRTSYERINADAGIIEDKTKCGELRECLEGLWNETFNDLTGDYDERIRAVLKATE